MITLEELKEKLRNRLIEHDGNIAPNELLDLVEEAQELGINKAQIARLVPEVDRSINWEHIRAEKAKAAKHLWQEQEKAEARKKEIEAAPEYLDALISFCMADGIVEAEELRAIFKKTEELEQSLFATAGKIKTLLDKGMFRPYPNADLNANGLHEVLMSTNWYTEKSWPVQEQQAKPQPVLPEAARIHTFTADKTEIKKGQYATLRWEVSGIDYLVISNLGRTTKLKGEQLVHPTETITYRLTAGNQQRDLSISVQQPAKGRRLGRAVLWILAAIVILRLIIWVAEHSTSGSVSSSTQDTTIVTSQAAPLTSSNAQPSNLSSSEEAGVIQTMNNYLRVQEEDNTSAAAITNACDFYAYPVSIYFSKKNASRQFVYNDILNYRAKYRPNHWAIDASQTNIRKLPDGSFSVDLAGNFSYYIRNPKVSDGYRERYIYNKYRLNSDFKITSVYTLK